MIDINMQNNNIISLIKNMGMSHKALMQEGLITDTNLSHLYESEETLELEIAPGIELVFWEETLCLEMITFSFARALNKADPVFMGILPYPLDKIRNKRDARLLLGAPMFTKSQMDLFPTELYGWDVYQLDSSLHPEAILDIQYNEDMLVSNILISLVDKNI
ncbi:Bacteriocin immunity protein [Pseudomonas syringae pv. philadelphi]|uniref:Bacteriocin immunity protein n=2 Tax=Pseudomonas syringae group genomosp. 3 TaxID=251701 RepID=A0A3M3YDD4_9PSED|nr:Bacteriocin immunity protein [Pseudomonas syringae pv. philadelphi]